MHRIIISAILILFANSISFGQEHYHKLDYYMYLFAKNIEWPDSLEKGNFIIGVLGETDANEHLFYLAKHKDIREMKVEIKVFEDASKLEFCHLLFVPDALSDQIPRALKNISLNTLMVTESPGKAVIGSGINIAWFDHFEKIQYEINKAAFRKAGLKISPQLTSSAAY